MTANELHAIRQRARLSQDQLAAVLRLAERRTVRRWEEGTAPITGPASIVLELLDTGQLPARFFPSDGGARC
jgi:DNA-binding transcriptional regulator YiaG